MPVFVQNIVASDWSISITDPGEIVTDIDDINQCLDIILTTVPGTDRLRPDFGCGIYEHMDRPAHIAVASMRKAIFEAVAKFEKRIALTRVELTYDADGNVNVDIEWETINKLQTGRNTVNYG